jgi:hypothetical protein
MLATKQSRPSVVHAVERVVGQGRQAPEQGRLTMFLLSCSRQFPKTELLNTQKQFLGPTSRMFGLTNTKGMKTPSTASPSP